MNIGSRPISTPYQPFLWEPISGKKSENGWFKLNVDGFAKNNLMGVGEVIPDDQGLWVVGFSKSVGTGKAITSEEWALFEGLKIAEHLGIEKIEA